MIARLVLVACLAFSAQPVVAKCSETRVDLRGDWGSARFTVEVADDEEERAIGLMNRPELPRSSGMLFIYDHPQRVGFWMENTLIPLDMVFMSEDGVVRHIHENAKPLDRTIIMGGSDDILAILEINGGMAGALGIDVGSELRHPLLDQSKAAWPCEAEATAD